MIRNRLRQCLSNENMSIRELYALLKDKGVKISRPTLQNLVLNRSNSVQLDHLSALCQIFNISLAELMEYLPYDYSMRLNLKSLTLFEKVEHDNTFMVIHRVNATVTLTKSTVRSTESVDLKLRLVKPDEALVTRNTATRVNRPRFKLISTGVDTPHVKQIWDQELTSGFRTDLTRQVEEQIDTVINEAVADQFGNEVAHELNRVVSQVDNKLYQK